MLATRARRSYLILLLATLTMSLGVVSLMAADKAKPAAKKAEAKGDAKADETADRYAVPDSDDADELIKFIQDLQKFRPKTRVEYEAHMEKMMPALQAAAEKVVKVADPDSDAYKGASGLLLRVKLSSLAKLDAKEQSKALEELKASYADKPIGGLEVQMAMSAAQELEYGEGRDVAAQIYTLFGDLGVKSKDEKVQKMAPMLQGAGRRLGLVGKPVELKGTTLDGKEFDWASYRGKVVLIDFWATWCGPCRAEMPNVRKNYDGYHEKGFEVVGVSLDQDRAALEKFLEKEGTPWMTLHEKDAGGASPMSEYYGVFGIPTVFLVDQQGKAVSTNARGPELGKLLKQLLGEPVEKKTDDPAGEDKSAAKAAPATEAK